MTEQGRSFFQAIQTAERVLVLDLGFLGDTIHLIPALHELRSALPNATIDVMAADHVKVILQVVPGLGEILGYPRFPKGPRWYQDFGRVSALRKRRYDAVINLNGSDRSSILTRATGARFRLGRVPPKPALFWPYCFSHTVDVQHGGRPVFQQRWECLEQAGFPVSAEPYFNVAVPADIDASVAEKLSGERGYIHVSPCTTQDHKELPMGELISLVDRLIEADGGQKVVLSCAPNDREREKMLTLLGGLKNEAWRVFSGDLSLLELAAVMGRATVHFGGDSGALHLALMMNAPTVSWFRDYGGKSEWLPQGPEHATILGVESPNGLKGISAEGLIAAWQRTS
ncbi:MAG: glycosyltransferase family 9 protein [Verrucomicrobiota bacterium]